MQRPLSSYPLSKGCLAQLAKAGFSRGEDLSGVGVVELSKELSIPHCEALEILKAVRGPVEVGQSAAMLLEEEQRLGHIVTFSSAVDALLGGGVALGRVTEVCGRPGTGKTQLSLQLSVDVSIPEAFGGVEGEVVYVDTEGSFIIERVVDIASACLQHLAVVAENTEEDELVQALNQLTLERLLCSIHYFRCHDYIELLALVNVLSEFVTQHPKVRLVVVDSVASCFRVGFEDMALRARLLFTVARSLLQLARQSGVAVVLTNQMTTRTGRQLGEPAHTVPALGESWGHACTQRIQLCCEEGKRWALLLKSPSHEEGSAPFTITSDGVRDDGAAPLESSSPLSHSQLRELELGGWGEGEEEEGEEEREGEGVSVKKKPRLISQPSTQHC